MKYNEYAAEEIFKSWPAGKDELQLDHELHII